VEITLRFQIPPDCGRGLRKKNMYKSYTCEMKIIMRSQTPSAKSHGERIQKRKYKQRKQLELIKIFIDRNVKLLLIISMTFSSKPKR